MVWSTRKKIRLAISVLLFLYTVQIFKWLNNSFYSSRTNTANKVIGASNNSNFVVFDESCLQHETSDPNLLSQKMFKDFKGCGRRPLYPHFSQNGEFWILNNFIIASKTFHCDETVTYTTHGEYSYLDNLPVLAARWKGPISVAVMAPDEDFSSAIDTILYLRECVSQDVKQLVTFHFFFPAKHRPPHIPSSEEVMGRKFDRCEDAAPAKRNITSRAELRLKYPINIARNIARKNANTYFNFPSDIELYPSINFIPEFFKMLEKPDVSPTTNPRVYVFPIFEIDEGQQPPETKAELQKMIRRKKAFLFHRNICSSCHHQPRSIDWIKRKAASELSVFHVGSRRHPFGKWEPIYVGTEQDPFYDERLSWEGQSDKMTQMYIMCVRDYEFHILDNAFLVHRPGIKQKEKDNARHRQSVKQSYAIRKKIFPEYRALFGKREGCKI